MPGLLLSLGRNEGGPLLSTNTLWEDPGCQPSHPLHEESHVVRKNDIQKPQLTCWNTAIHRSWVSLPLSSSLPATDSKMNGIFLFDIFRFLMARSKDFLPPGWAFAFKWVFSVAEKLWLLFPVCSPAPSKSCTWEPEPPTSGDAPWVS